VTECYRLIKFGGAQRILFLVDRANLGKQAKNEFDLWHSPYTQRRFTDEYIVQRLYSALTGKPIDDTEDERSTYEAKHGDGGSAQQLRARNPKLFEDDHGHTHLMPLRLLIGQGLRLIEDNFKAYKICLEEFWSDLTAALLPVFCPQPKPPTTELKECHGTTSE